jgi:hypothetical protein
MGKRVGLAGGIVRAPKSVVPGSAGGEPYWSFCSVLFGLIRFAAK